MKFLAKNRPPGEASPFAPRGIPVQPSPEFARIASLPSRPQPELAGPRAVATVQRETARFARDRSTLGPCRCHQLNPDKGCITQLLPVQAVCLREMRMVRGLVGAVVVGAGKSGIDLLAILALGLRRDLNQHGLLLIPASLRKQICDDIDLWNEHFVLPDIIVHRPGGDYKCRNPTQPILHIMSHDAVSSPRDSDYIEQLRPAAIIVDECHAFANLESARTMRLLRSFDGDEGDRIKFCCWSGSITDKSVTEMPHLFALALKAGSPLPHDPDVCEDMSRCVSATEAPCPPGALMELVTDKDAGHNDLERVKNAMRRRLRETPGIIITGSVDVYVMDEHNRPTSTVVELDVVARDVPEIPENVQQALDKVRDMKRPDTLAGAEFDDPIADDMEQAKYARQVACGMFYYATYPRGEPRDLVEEWHGAKKAWFADRRERKLRGERFMDSEKLVEDAARRGWGEIPEVDDRPSWRPESWDWWRQVQGREWTDSSGRTQVGVKPVTKAARLSPFLVEDAARWALDHKGIVWYGMVELGEWISELTDLPLMDGGPDAEDRLKRELRARNNRSIIASIKSHGQGRDGLQHHFYEQYVINTLSSGRWWEQLLGRAHRSGQRSSKVHTEVCLHTEELRKSFDQALRRSDYVFDYLHQTLKLRKAIPK